MKLTRLGYFIPRKAQQYRTAVRREREARDALDRADAEHYHARNVHAAARRRLDRATKELWQEHEV